MTLIEICQQLGLAPSAGQLAGLHRYVDLLQQWNATYNLTAVRDPERILTHHLADCLSLVGPLQRQLSAGDVLDVGSGGGLPGVVVALMAPHLRVTCVDAVRKKAAFVRQVAGVLQLPNLQSVHSRVEALQGARYDVIVSRAFASLVDFAQVTEARLNSGGVWLAMKGKDPAGEIAELPATVAVFHVEQLTVPGLDAERCLVWMRRTTSPDNAPRPMPTPSAS